MRRYVKLLESSKGGNAQVRMGTNDADGHGFRAYRGADPRPSGGMAAMGMMAIQARTSARRQRDPVSRTVDIQGGEPSLRESC